MEVRKIACDNTKILVDSETTFHGIFDRYGRSSTTYTKYKFRTFLISFDPWQKGRIVTTCPHCNYSVTIDIISPRKIVSEQESLAMSLKKKRIEKIVGAIIGGVFLIGGAIALFFRTTPCLYVISFFIGIAGLVAILNAHRERVEIPKGPQLIKEEFKVSEGHFLISDVSIEILGPHKSE